MSDIIPIISSILAGGGLALVLVTFLGKKLLENIITRESERFKSELTAKTESLKTELSILAHEKNILASRVDAQKSEGIRIIFSSLLKLALIATRATQEPVPESELPEERYNQIKESYWSELPSEYLDIVMDILNNAIYLNKELYSRVLGSVNTIGVLIPRIHIWIQSIDSSEVVNTDSVAKLEETINQIRVNYSEYTKSVSNLTDELREKLRATN